MDFRIEVKGRGGAHIIHMKRAHSPRMDEPELSKSPRKKVKLEKSSLDATIEAPAMPQVMASIPHDRLPATNNHLSNPGTTSAAGASTVPRAPTTSAHDPVPMIAMPESKVEYSHHYSEALGNLLNEQATNAPEAKPDIEGLADAPENGDDKEAACGITEFVSPHLLGFSGILKKRYVFLIATH